MMTRSTQAIGLVVSVILCFTAAAVGGLFTDTGAWYQALEKPWWNPPDWVFAPVWTVLYLSMAIAAWLVWRRAGFRGGAAALGLFAVQLALNVAWSGIFFGLQSPGYALIEIVVLWAAIAATIAAFHRRSTAAAWLLGPYLVWVSFAAALNGTIWMLN